MIKIKLSTPNPDFPLLRQTPDSAGIWGNCVFYINQDIEECDYWIVYDALSKNEKTKCPKENIILFTGEPPSVKHYSNNFLSQFGTLITCHPNLKHKHVIMKQQCLPWMAGAKYLKNEKHWDSTNFIGYNDFTTLGFQKKEKEISIILSSKTYTEGHEKRIRFLNRLKEVFGDRMDIYGRGFNEIEDKYGSIAEYKYSIVLENSSYRDYWTEKLADVYLCGSFPVYYGCPNILDYFPEHSLEIIDINNTEESIDKIKHIIESGTYERSLDLISQSKDLILNKYNLFPAIVTLIGNLEKKGNSLTKKQLIRLYPERRFEKLPEK